MLKLFVILFIIKLYARINLYFKFLCIEKDILLENIVWENVVYTIKFLVKFL